MWALSTRRPNDQFVGLNRIFNDNFDPATVFNGWVPAVDVQEDEQGIRLSAEIPGYKPESVKVTLENQVLTMSGEKANGSFRRRFTVPNTVDTDRIEATVEHGVLTISLPRAERAKPREIPVKAQV